ncbi:pectate lyase family protein [Vibrio mangrovi]|uniref:Pectin lyase n=1 Tax=Vibrio mangrovi TaxID=474394 RepID=A0A1Y6IU10_9VIBR|nr:hypothetical protein [Vibrio mangrovi]MDW6003240.1 hypothetical protein [Vibrio mangrovi]SMR99972.1 Pectin lyase [Vibrio mangrovi]
MINSVDSSRLNVSITFQDPMSQGGSGNLSPQSTQTQAPGKSYIDYSNSSAPMRPDHNQFNPNSGMRGMDGLEQISLKDIIRDIIQELFKLFDKQNGQSNDQPGAPSVGSPSSGGSPSSAPFSQPQTTQPQMTPPQTAGNTSAVSPQSAAPAALTAAKPETTGNAQPQAAPAVNALQGGEAVKGSKAAAQPDAAIGAAPDKSAAPSAIATPQVNTVKNADSVKATSAVGDVEASKNVSAAAKTSAVSSSQEAGSVAGMEGFAKVAKTTGGAGGETVTVNSVGELKEALSGDDPRIIKLGSNLSAAEKTDLEFGANKTIIGDGKNNQLHNIYLKSGDSAGNDIFQNLHFTHDDKYTANNDIPLYIDKGQGYWIDHSTFSGTKGDNYQGGKDKLLYVGGTADMVSLTNSKFENNEYGLILGYPEDTQAAADKYTGYPRMTIAHNDFENLDVRAPGLMRYGQFDVYNNHIDDFNLGFTAASNATIFSESNFFENGRNGGGQASLSGMLDDKGNAHFTDVGSNISVQNQKSGETSWRGGPYERNVSSAEAAKQFATENAGVQDGTLKFAG